MASNGIGRARAGTEPFAKKVALRLVAPVNAGPIFFVVLAASAIHSVADFKGKRIAVGPKGSGMEQHARTIFGVLNITFNSFTPVHMSFADGARALMTGDIDVQFHPPVPNRVMSDLSQRADVRVVPYAPGQAKKIVEAVPFYRLVTMEKDVFRGVTEKITQIGVLNVLVTHERVPEPLTHDMAHAVVANLDKLPEMNPLFRGVEELFEPLRDRGAAAFECSGVALHAGAARAYRELGWLK
jgi:TRAP transporter TAXI family solute receptor